MNTPLSAPDDFDPVIGQPQQLDDGLRRVVADNASPMTYRGTNTYLVGEGDVAVIDPGPSSETHLQALLGALKPKERISHIFVTHSHTDHSPLAKPLSQVTGAPVLAFGDSKSGRSDTMNDLAAQGLAGGGEGVDEGFAPDIMLVDGESVHHGDWALTALHTPGHFGNHLSFAMRDMVFCGDLVMGWASSLVSPPDGDLTAFMASCRKLATRDWRVFHAGHGAPIEDPEARLNWLIEHRLGREAQILAALENSPATAEALARQIYTETPPALIPAATRNVFAHLIDLHIHKRVSAAPQLSAEAVFALV
ncbi:MBL fold metallo-hydrolase [Lentibacter algarum]|uniref:MBL fold metallo-hydrolase n=1 Tax=Lentibacter algarum TaxID=576131 RepID=UPI001C075792|nr:MBL fold metallo-hydrolase [Lentibacter algarum]MBU2982172.1 MBL fold metallo-hydrolase [Lentibacter algarum]